MMSEKVVVLGASPKPERYANQAVARLLEYGHQVYPIHPIAKTIHEQTCYKNLATLPTEAIDTLTLYLGKAGTDKMSAEILALAPKRIIFNPGTENADLFAQAEAAGITVINACTLVMLETNEF